MFPPSDDGVDGYAKSPLLPRQEKKTLPTSSRDDAPVGTVCLALTLALFALAFRIAAFW
jgi:hypothetical protein